MPRTHRLDASRVHGRWDQSIPRCPAEGVALDRDHPWLRPPRAAPRAPAAVPHALGYLRRRPRRIQSRHRAPVWAVPRHHGCGAGRAGRFRTNHQLARRARGQLADAAVCWLHAPGSDRGRPGRRPALGAGGGAVPSPIPPCLACPPVTGDRRSGDVRRGWRRARPRPI